MHLLAVFQRRNTRDMPVILRQAVNRNARKIRVIPQALTAFARYVRPETASLFPAVSTKANVYGTVFFSGTPMSASSLKTASNGLCPGKYSVSVSPKSASNSR